jgi:type I restriction enzyme S subunit
MTLSEIAIMKRGTYVTKKNTVRGNIPVILGGQEPAYYCDTHNHAGEAIVISRSGAYAGFVSFWNQPIFVTDGFIIEAKDNQSISKYLYYFLKNAQETLHQMKRGAGVPHVRGNEIMEINIPIPSLEEQRRIADTLDKFEALVNDITQGLPAEIEARRKQYEYYRDKLLTFKEKETVS